MAIVRWIAIFAVALTAIDLRAADSRITLVQFTASQCQPCASMQPIMAKLASEGWQVRQIDAANDVAAVKRFEVTSLPTLFILRDGQVVDRIIGALGYAKLEARCQSAVGSQPLPDMVRGQSPGGLSPFPMLSAGAVAAAAAVSSAPSSSPAASADRPRTAIADTRGPSQVQELAQSPDALSTLTIEEAIAIASAATVRIRIDESNAISFGTGTVISVHGDQALVLTCGHMFRDLKAGAKMTVDLWFEGREISLPAQLVSYNLKDCDIGLMEFRTPVAIKPVTIAPLDQSPNVGDSAFSFGCDRGADPTRRDTRIKRINRYLGAANIEIHGAPVVGRSGGGLFDAQGRLVGVCNAADEEDDEGIYAALPVMHQHLAALKLPEIESPGRLPQREPAPTQLAAVALGPAESDPWPDSSAAFPARVSPATSRVSPALLPVSPASSVVQASSAGLVSPSVSRGPVSPSAVSTIRCVVTDATGHESLITIDNPSDALLHSLHQQAR